MPKTTEETPPEPRVEPNIDAIVELLKPNGEIEKAAKMQAEGMTTMGQIFQKIEKNHNGNRAAVALIRRMDKMSDDKRADFVRTMEPLLVTRGYTLDDIDPKDLVSQAGGAGGGSAPAASGDAPAAEGDNSTLSGLDAARERLAGEGSEETKAAAAAKTGSVQLRKLVGALRAGWALADAAGYAGIIESEAEFHAQAESAGEFADLDVIPPPVKRGGKPKLGIVPPSDTVQ